jgi:hypothetical protein
MWHGEYVVVVCLYAVVLYIRDMDSVKKTNKKILRKEGGEVG